MSRLGNLLDHLGALGLFRRQFHLDQFMGFKGDANLFHDIPPQAMLTDPDHRLEVMGQAAQVADLLIGQ